MKTKSNILAILTFFVLFIFSCSSDSDREEDVIQEVNVFNEFVNALGVESRDDSGFNLERTFGYVFSASKEGKLTKAYIRIPSNSLPQSSILSAVVSDLEFTIWDFDNGSKMFISNLDHTNSEDFREINVSLDIKEGKKYAITLTSQVYFENSQPVTSILPFSSKGITIHNLLANDGNSFNTIPSISEDEYLGDISFDFER
ncbi:hypothetical protein [Aestuariibaculum suncheonense]|uniref:DUF4082 domain-containing protein n=1 Tax=Aestuariibaculum suncheonense TaxID=1028745 RepID=A0A8J6UAJ8_9FLAO|nr:hypothetical protein [Aestuariibaculum suncheonense]MBD0834482.1 hypothetical protein [Aestuariibaculum suncheonense]